MNEMALIDSGLFAFRDDRPNEKGTGTNTTLELLTKDIDFYGPEQIDPALIPLTLRFAVTNDVTRGSKTVTPEQTIQIRSILQEAVEGKRPGIEILREEIDDAIKQMLRLKESNKPEDQRLLKSSHDAGVQYLELYKSTHN